jgi:hypothetical protein
MCPMAALTADNRPESPPDARAPETCAGRTSCLPYATSSGAMPPVSSQALLMRLSCPHVRVRKRPEESRKRIAPSGLMAREHFSRLLVSNAATARQYHGWSGARAPTSRPTPRSAWSAPASPSTRASRCLYPSGEGAPGVWPWWRGLAGGSVRMPMDTCQGNCLLAAHSLLRIPGAPAITPWSRVCW